MTMSNIKIDQNTKILVVDDMDSVRIILISILEEMGFTNILQAVNGQDAMAKFLDETESIRNIDIIVADLNMPIMNGLELLKAIRGHYFGGEVPFLIVTTEQEKDTVLDCVQAGASDYIIKPFKKEIVKERIYAAYALLNLE
jgi:two-component system, chemotaxis family, chemotaxis protein CheY